MFTQNKVKIRQARIEDIPQILEVEKAAWGEGRSATFEMLESRIETFPAGTLVALVNEEIVGVLATEIIDYNLKEEALSWYEVTDNGYIRKTHNPKGDTLYGADLSVHPLYQNQGVGKKLLVCIGRLAIKYNLKRGLLGARIPNYYKYVDKIKVEDYIQLDKKSSDIPPDPELIYYRNVTNLLSKLGLQIVKVLPNYFKDPESLNYGVLLIWGNPFYNKWYRWVAAKFFRA
jgi:ribosomal protein S18 acetylase RimI-like enzyme